MKFRSVFFAAIVLTVVALFWSREGKVAPPQPPQPSTVSSRVIQAPIPPEAVVATPVTAPAPEVLAAMPEAIRAFRVWFEAYQAAAPDEKVKMEAEGVQLAKAHTREIARLIQMDPQLAIALAVPMVVRQDLPQAILASLEERPRLRGDYEIYGNVPMPGAEAKIEPYSRTVTAEDGKRWNAHVYGKRQWQRTMTKVSVNGVAVGREMALSDSPLRVLEVGERPQANGREVVDICPISGIETPVEMTSAGALPAVTEETPAFETPERIIYVCSGGHISQVAEQYSSEEERAYWESMGTVLNAGASSGPAHGPVGTVPGGWTTGHRTFLYIRAAFPDNPVDPQTEQECHDMLKTMSDYVLQTSYGRCYFTYAVPPLVILPYPLAWYSRYDTDVGGGDTLIQNQARQIARNMGYDNNSYNLDGVRWSGGPGSYGGSASVGARGMRMKTSSSSTFIHELGHNLGVWHANFWRTTPPSFTGPGNNLEYGNIFDVMGSSSGQFTSSFKNTLSWMPQEQFWNVTSSGLYRIHQTDAATADPNHRYAIRIKRDSERDYWAEFRLRHTGNTGFTNGLMMTWDRWGLSGIGGSGGAPLNGSNAGAQLLDMTPGSFSSSISDTRNDSALWVGRTYSDPDTNVHFTPIAKNSGTTPPSMDVRVQIGDAPGNNAPTLSINASSTTPGVGSNITLTATANDVDGDPLAYAWVFDDGNYSINNAAVQTKSWSAAGHYQVLCTASDMKGKRVTRSLLITVGSPATFTVSGNITGPDALPLEGVYVANFAPSNTTSHSNSATFRGAWTDSNGNYTITGLAAGSFTITPNLYPLVFTRSGFTNPVSVGPSTTGKNFTSVSLPAVTISYPDDTANEGPVPGTAVIRLNREGSTTAAVSVQIYNTNTGSATRNIDYTLSPAPAAATSPDGGSGTSEYVIPAGVSFLDITVTPINDSIAEGIEYASLDFVNTASGYIMAGGARAVVPIIDDDSSLPVVKITSVDDSGHEAGSDTITLKLERNGPTTSALTVNLSYTGTAARGPDYTAATSVVIPAGELSATLILTPVDDTDIETTETIITTISTSAAYIRDGTAQAVTCILNDDDMPVVTLATTDASASETAPDIGVFTITRTGSTAAALTVDYSVGGRAVMGTDYRRLDGYSLIPAGSSSITVEIVPFDDDIDEGTQDVILQLRTSQSYVIGGTGQGTVTIADNDGSQVYLKLNTATGVEPSSGSANGPVFQITRPATGTAMTVNYSISGTATSGSDFTALPGSIAFATTDLSKTITVSMLADALFEDAETVTMTLQPGTGYTLMPGQLTSMTAYIYDSGQEVVDVNVYDSSSTLLTHLVESTTAGARFLLSRRVATASALVVNYTMSGTATSGSDYTALSGTATIPASSTSVYVTVLPVDDTIPEGVESIIMNVTPISGSYGTRFASATMLMADNDSFPSGSVAFSSGTGSTTEDVGIRNIAVNITGTPPGAVSVSYRVNGGTAAGNGVDYSLPQGVLNFGVGETTKNIPVTIIHDKLPEPAETVVVQLYNAAGANLGTSTHTLTINNVSMPEAFSDPATSILSNGATFNGRVMPGGLATTYWFEYGGSTSYGQVTATQNAAAGNSMLNVNRVVTGLTLSGYHYRLVAQNSLGTTFGINQFFGINNSPSVTTLAATNVNVTSATLNGTANSNGAAGSAWFEYGLTTAYGSATPPQALGAVSTNVPMTRNLTGLEQNTTYHFRAVVQNTVGIVYGGGFSFTTPTPMLVRTGSFTGTAQTGIVCDGFINPGGLPATYYFEYGPDTNYGSQTASESAGSGGSVVTVRFTLNGLNPDTEYHFRLVGANASSTTFGDDQTIRTLESSPASIVEPVFQFTGTGTSPLAPLALASDGTLWGVTNTGGTFNRGTAFKLSAGGTMTPLVSFYGNTNLTESGNGPQGNLLQASDGNFYGTTNTGGSSNSGSIFRLTPQGELTPLASLTGTSGVALGTNPINGLVQGNDGHLYGVTQTGGGSSNGTIFRISSSGVFTSMVIFSGTSGLNLGSAPRGNLVLASDGNFYGTTATGGSGGGFGTIFKMTHAGVLTTLVNFTGTSGANPGATPTSGLLQHSDGDFYGMTSVGGTGNLGTLFKVTAAGVHTVIAEFTGITGAVLGSAPKGTLAQDGDGFLYGTTTTGGNSGTGLGTIFKCSTAGAFTTMVNFTGSSGAALGQTPNGGLVLHPNGEFYGTTNLGGSYNVGTLFKVSSDGILTTLVSLTPFPTLSTLRQASDGKFYGTTLGGGGASGAGTAFAMPVGGAPQILTTFGPNTATTPWNSRGGFIQGSDSALYATAGGGGNGTTTTGSVFRLTTAGALSTLVGFSGTTGNNLGQNPQAALITGHDGLLWGTTASGGTGSGTIFRTTTGGTHSVMISFTGTTGANLGSNVLSPLTLASDGNYYGATGSGGANNVGTLYKLTPGAVHSVLHSFIAAGGATPTGPLVEGPGGHLYGCTTLGGAASLGTVFRITKAGVFTSLASFTGTAGTLPGQTPNAGLYAGPDGHLYGVTTTGGEFGAGTLFRVNSDGTVQNVEAFSGREEGMSPSHGLVLASNGRFYGVSATGSYTVNLPPVPLASPASAVTASSAQLNGLLTPEFHSGNVFFEYGSSSSYGSATTPVAFTTGLAAVPLSSNITGLNPLQTYRYRLVAVTDEGTYFSIERTFSTPSTVTFASAGAVPVTSNEYSAGGLSVGVSLGFAPVPGTVLKLVNNTGFQPVSGFFNNLPEGSTLTALHNAQPYLFEISYSGGDGNDIVLTAVDQVITFPPVSVKYVGDPAFVLSATASSALPVSYQIVGGATSASVSGSTVTLTTTTGVITIKATQAGNGSTIGAALPKYQTFALAAAGTGFVQLSASKASEFSHGIRSNGTLWAWGINTNGQLGDSSISVRRTQVQAGTATNWRQVSNGSSHTVATRTDGTLWAWGLNTDGRVGDGTTTTPRTSPVQIGVDTNWAHAVAGASHTVAVKTNGTLWAWGANGSGQVGQGNITTASYLVPTQIGSLTTWATSSASLHAGGDFTLALRNDGTLWAWGLNSSGQLGDSSTTLRNAPVQAGTASNWTRVAACTAASAGLRSDGTLWTWGVNSSSQLGDGSLTLRSSPAQLGSATTWQNIIGGSLHFLARQSNGTVWSWGGNILGQLGQNSTFSTAVGNTPQQINGFTNWQEIAAGLNHSLATTSDGALHAWGSNNNGQTGSVPRVALPVAHNLGAVSDIGSGGNGSMVQRTDGSLLTFGINASGQLGIGVTDSSPHPIPSRITSGSIWKQLSRGNNHTLGVRTNGTLWGYGFNTSGQLGDGSIFNRNELLQIGSDNDWASVVAADTHSLGLKQDGSLWAWGLNTSGQLGNGTNIPSSVPVQVGTAMDWKSVYTGNSGYSMALKQDGTLWAWGINANSQLGDGTTTARNTPAQVGSFNDWSKIATGVSYVLAIRSNGTLWAWGLAGSNQLGSGSTTTISVPTQIGSATNWKSVAAASVHSIATRTDGTLWSWGVSTYGNLGNGSFSSRTTPVQVGNAICWNEAMPSHGANHSLVTTTDGSLWAFGYNNFGQIALAERSQLEPAIIIPAPTAVPQTLTFSTPGSASIGTTLTLAATSSSGLPVRYIVSGAANLNGDKLTITGSGFVSVIAYQPGDSFWQASDIRHAYINLAAPVVTSLAASSVTATSATLNATVNPNGAPTTARFQFGTTISYGTDWPITLSPPNGNAVQSVSVNLTGLIPGTTYQYRVAASSLGGSPNGVNIVFQTPSNNADIATLTLSAGTLSPIFASATQSYSADVPFANNTVNFTPTAANANAVLKLRVNGGPFATVSSGAAVPVSISGGSNLVEIQSLAQDGVTVKTYAVTVTRSQTYSQFASAAGLTGGGANTLPGGDFDLDGILNLLEYAFGTLPNVAGSGNSSLEIAGNVLVANGQPITIIDYPPGEDPVYRVVFIRRRDAAQVGLSYTPKFSVDLEAWENSADTPEVLAQNADYEAVALPYPLIGGEQSHFFQVQVTLAP